MNTPKTSSLWIFLAAFLVLAFIAVTAAFATGALGGKSQLAAAVAANLATDNTFAVLASTYTNTTAGTVLTGDLGYTTGPATAPTVSGTTHAADSSYTQAGTDEAAALSTLNAEPCDFTFGSTQDLSLLSQPLLPGVYCITGAASIGTGGITLSGSGAYLFRVTGALTTTANSVVTLAGGATACNVFWTPGAATTLGANTTFVGTDIDNSGITVGSTVAWAGRALSFAGTVSTNVDAVSVPTSCTAPTPTATLHLIKQVINVSGGTAIPANFNLHVISATSTVDVAGSPQPGAATPGTLYTLSPGTYTVSEDPNASYTQTFFGADCPGGSVTLASGDNKTCTIINTDIPPPVVPATGGGSYYIAPLVPLINIVKVPTPLALPSGGGSVSYAYTVTDVGEQPLTDVSVTDDKCSPVRLLSGDTNGDGKLDVGEKWLYGCTATVASTTTDTATATGYSDDTYHQPAVATAVATVAVGTPPPPLISIVKVPSRLTPFPYGGGTVTYTYTITNPGTVAIHGVTVTDDKCAPVTFASGDTNGNDLLDPGEVWTYSCQSNIPVSTRNLATAEGEANGFTALGYAFATVLVDAPEPPATAVPILPNTGLPPESSSVLMPSAIALAEPPEEQAAIETPLRLEIPEIGIDAAIESTGLTQSGALGTPQGPADAAWFDQSPLPGQAGTSIIDGHFGWKGDIPAVFDNLSKLQAGDTLSVTNGNKTTMFVVRSVRTYAADENVPSVFDASDGGTHLNLITCEGTWNAATKSYSGRLVVFTDKLN